MKKAKARGQDFNKSLLIYRSTPLQCGLSPAQLLMNHRIRNNLPVNKALLQFPNSTVRNFQAERNTQKYYYDKSAHDLPILTNGSCVRMFSFAKNNWSLKGKIVKLLSPRSYLVCGENGTVYRRNRIHFRNDKSTTTINYQKQYVKNDDEIINNNQTLLRRSTRIVRKPQRLIESM